MALDKNLLGKPVLQESLRPNSLTHLTNYNLITLGLLRHLHRLLDLLSSQFNVTLGEKLIEHLRKWVDVETYIHPQPPQAVAWEPGTEWEVAAGMMDVLHKLPPQKRRASWRLKVRFNEIHTILGILPFWI